MAHTHIRENPTPLGRPRPVVGTGHQRPHSRMSSNYRPRHQTGWARPAWQQKYLSGLIGTEIAAAFLGAAVAFVARFGVVNSHSRIYVFTLLLLPLLWLIMLGLARAFESRYLFVGTDEYQRVVHAALGLTALVALVSYAFELPISRAFVLIAIPVTAMSSILARFLWRQWLHRVRRYGRCMKKVIVVGHESSVAALTGQLQREHYHGLQVVGACVPMGRALGAMLEFDAPVWGGFEDVADSVLASGADTVIVLSCPEFDGVALRRLAWRLERGEVELIVASALVDIAGDRTTVRPVDGLPMLHLEHATLTGARHVIKELVDRVGAALLLIVLSPVLLGSVIAIRASSPGPALFKQERIGRGGVPFTIWKFRTMYVDAERRLAGLQHLNETDGVLFKMREDPRVTKVGKFLRRFSIDELPQLINVLRGNMSLVGPRPPLKTEVAAYAPDTRRRLAVKPGMTGLWQVSGRSDLSWEEAVRLDLRYVERWSLSLDLVILLRTVTAVARTQGAY